MRLQMTECAYIDDTRINGPNHMEFGVRRHQRRCVSGIRGHPRRRILMQSSNHMSFLLISKLKTLPRLADGILSSFSSITRAKDASSANIQ